VQPYRNQVQHIVLHLRGLHTYLSYPPQIYRNQVRHIVFWRAFTLWYP
jgi:hypothetical protein